MVLAPNLPAFALAAAGTVAECALLRRGEDSVYDHGLWLAVLAPVFVAWFWVTTGWALWAVGRGAARLGARGGRVWRWSVHAALVLAVGLPALFYLTSWGLFFQAGQFANVESVEFALSNWNCVYFLHTERTHLLPFALAAGAMLAALPLLLRVIATARWRAADWPGLGRWRRLAWYALTLAWLGLAFVINSDHADHWVRQSLRMGMVERRLNPVVTLVASLKESWLVEPIAPCLATSELAPIGSGWQVPASATNRPSVILLSVEALRHDVVLLRHQGQEIMPHLNALARRGLHFTRAYSQSSQTDYAAACVPSSLYPLRERWHHYYRPDDPWPVTRLYDLLKPAGYATAMFSAEDEIWGGLSSFWQTPNLDLFWDACREAAQTNVLAATPMAWEERFLKRGVFGVSDDCIATRAIRWMRQRGPQPFYLGLYFGSSHFPYTLEASCPRPFQPCAIDFDVSFLRYPREKAEVMRNAYFNALREADRQIGRLVGALREMGRLDNTILLVCGDHGESFHENNSVVHAREPFEPSLRIACVLHAPALVQPRREDYPVEAVDFAPTLLGLMGRPRHPNHQGINVLASDRPPLSERALFFHTENPFTRTDAVLLAGRWKFWLDRAHQREALYDLASRPGEMEADNVAAHEPALTARLRALLLSWRARQLAYYAHPFYYRNFYPPRPPGLSLITHHSSKP